MASRALVRLPQQAVGSFRWIYQHYRGAAWGWHVVVPVVSFGIAAGALSWASTMLDRNEYAAAMVLVFWFLIIGVGASLAIPRKLLSVGGVIVVIMITVLSALKVWQEKGDKHWSSLLSHKEETVRVPNPRPTPIPTQLPPPSPTPSSTPPNTNIIVRKKRRVKLSPEDKWILRQLNSNKNAHASVVQKDNEISKEKLKSVLTRKLSKRGLDLLAMQIRKRRVSFPLTSDNEQELRSFASQHGNRNIDSLILAVRQNSASVPPSIKSADATYHDQFLMYPSFLRTAVRRYWYFPPGELPVQFEARLVFNYRVNGIKSKQLAVYIPGASSGFIVGEMCSHVIKHAKEWAEEIDKLEAEGSTEFASATQIFTLMPFLLLFHDTPMLDRRAEWLRQQGHTVIGPERPFENPEQATAFSLISKANKAMFLVKVRRSHRPRDFYIQG